MRHLILASFFILVSIVSFSQRTYNIKADSVAITNNSANAELILENSTKNINGFLYNKGNGRTEFRKLVIRLNDTTFISGSDTLTMPSSFGSGAAWTLTGNSGTNSLNNFLGTNDNSRLVFKTNGIQRASIGADGVINFEVNDTATKPAFRFYPNGDFVVKAKRELAGNTFGPNNGLRYNAKYGIFEVGTDNNFDTTLSTVCCGSQVKSAIVVNSDFINTFKGDIHGSVIGGDNMTVDTAGGIAWSPVFGESHYINGHVIKSGITGYGMNVAAGLMASTLSGFNHQITKYVTSSSISGFFNKTIDTLHASLVSGILNSVGGIGQTVSGVNLTEKTPYGVAFGNKNVDFTSLNYLNYQQGFNTQSIANLSSYPLLSLGNSKYYNNTSYSSNALTILFNGRTQINTTGFDNNLTESDVTPKAAFEVVSNNSGILIPRLSTSQINNIATQDLRNGLLLYNTDSSKFQYYNGNNWTSIMSMQAQIEAPIAILKTTTVSNVATFDVDLTNYYNLYDKIELEFLNVRPANNNVTLQLLVSSDGTNFDNGVNNYKFSSSYSISTGQSGGHVSNGDAKINLGDMVGNGSTGSFAGTVTLYDADNASLHPFVKIQVGYTNNVGDLITNVGWGKRTAAQVTKKIRILASSGNISGTVKIIGYR